MKDEAGSLTATEARQKADPASLEKRAANEAKAGKAIDAVQPARPAERVLIQKADGVRIESGFDKPEIVRFSESQGRGSRNHHRPGDAIG